MGSDTKAYDHTTLCVDDVDTQNGYDRASRSPLCRVQIVRTKKMLANTAIGQPDIPVMHFRIVVWKRFNDHASMTTRKYLLTPSTRRRS